MNLQDNERLIESVIKEHFQCNVSSIEAVGKGAVGKVYKVVMDIEPKVVAVKICTNREVLKQEYRYISAISAKIDIKLPKIYFLHLDENDERNNYLCMEFINGVSSNNNKFLWKSKQKKKNFATQVSQLLEKLATVNNDKYGKLDEANFDNWHNYYRPFATFVIEATKSAVQQGEFLDCVYQVMKIAYDNYDKIFDEPVSLPTLTHGDFWTPNIMVNPKTLDVVGVVDPFNVLWADREYELFAVVAALGKKFKILETYKKRNSTSQKIDLKIEFYALFSEVYWYTITHNKFNNFMKYKAKLLSKQMKKFGLI